MDRKNIEETEYQVVYRYIEPHGDKDREEVKSVTEKQNEDVELMSLSLKVFFRGNSNCC